MEAVDFAGGFSRGCEFLDDTGKLRDFFSYQPGQKLDMAGRPGCQVLERRFSGNKPIEIIRVEYRSEDVCGVFYCSPDQKLAGGQLAGELCPGSKLSRPNGLEPANVVAVLRGGALPALWTMATPDGIFELAPGILAEVPKTA